MKLLALALALSVAACSSSSPDDPVGNSAAAVDGMVSFAPDCSGEDQQHILAALGAARIIANSPAFQGCVRAAMSGIVPTPDMSYPDSIGPYHPCNPPHTVTEGPPYDDPATNADRVIAIARGSNPMFFDCRVQDSDQRDPTEGEVARIYDAGSTGVENIQINSTRENFLDPASVASVILHEEMHTHGFHHGDSPYGAAQCNAPALGAEANEGGSWGYRHTIPRIVDECVSLVVKRSIEVCGQDYDTSCGSHQLNLVSNYWYTPQSISFGRWRPLHVCACATDPIYPPCVPGRGCFYRTVGK